MNVAGWLGAALGVLLASWFLVYLPMKANYEQCGRVTFCDWERDFAIRKYDFGEVGVKAMQDESGRVLIVTCIEQDGATRCRDWYLHE